MEPAILVAAEAEFAGAAGIVAVLVVAARFAAAGTAAGSASTHGLAMRFGRHEQHERRGRHAYSCRREHPGAAERQKTDFGEGHWEESPAHLHSTTMAVFL